MPGEDAPEGGRVAKVKTAIRLIKEAIRLIHDESAVGSYDLGMKKLYTACAALGDPFSARFVSTLTDPVWERLETVDLRTIASKPPRPLGPRFPDPEEGEPNAQSE